jgi:hypothetical protein
MRAGARNAEESTAAAFDWVGIEQSLDDRGNAVFPPAKCKAMRRNRDPLRRRPGFRCTTATWQFGAVRTDCTITA